MRPSQPKAKIADARIGYLNGLFFVNLDAWGLEPGEQPKLLDFAPARSMSPAAISTGKNGRAKCRLQCRHEAHYRAVRRPSPHRVQAARLRRRSARPGRSPTSSRPSAALPLTCAQFDLHQTARVRECLDELGATAEVARGRRTCGTCRRGSTRVIFPASAHADRELKIDVIEQAYHVLNPGGLFLTLSEYEKDNQFAKWQKKVFGKCGETPASENGMAFFSTKTDDELRRAAGTRSRSTRRSATARR